jgi:hypothetical protein
MSGSIAHFNVIGGSLPLPLACEECSTILSNREYSGSSECHYIDSDWYKARSTNWKVNRVNRRTGSVDTRHHPMKTKIGKHLIGIS